VRVAEGKIKADGTIVGHRAQNIVVCTLVGDGARHRPEGGTVPRFWRNASIRGTFKRHHGWIFGIFRPLGWRSADEPG